MSDAPSHDPITAPAASPDSIEPVTGAPVVGEALVAAPAVAAPAVAAPAVAAPVVSAPVVPPAVVAAPVVEAPGGGLAHRCPRCGVEVTQRFYGPCASCRRSLVEACATTPTDGGVVARNGEDLPARFEPRMHVTPNAVATKD